MNAQEFRTQAIIQQLKQMEVDGETMQYILKQIGMEDQMLRQLIMTQPLYMVYDLHNERLNLEMEFDSKDIKYEDEEGGMRHCGDDYYEK